MTLSAAQVTIRQFRAGDDTAFRNLNEAWISRYFAIEPKDLISFADPQRTIIDNGGRILFALKNDEIVACCALLAMGAAEFEVAKMAVAEAHQSSGLGRRLLQETIALARTLGATRLYLETNTRLAPAVKLYESVGFRHLPPARITPSPYARANVYMELVLSHT